MTAGGTMIDISTEMGEALRLDPGGVPLGQLAAMGALEHGEGLHPRHRASRDDAAVLPFVTSASLACGMHSGDPLVMRETVSALAARGIAIGAHPSYPDLFRFGQHRIPMTAEDLMAVLLFQLGGLAAVAAPLGVRLRHVKCHGALAFDVSWTEDGCDVLVDAVRAFDPGMILVLMAGSPGLSRARGRGMRVASEAYLDRNYGPDGHILPRSRPDALVAGEEEAARRALDVAVRGVVRDVHGAELPLKADTLCLHCDTPGAAKLAAAACAALAENGVRTGPLIAR
jgi:5-oxoprolinase (ATP-hydrolysing) subunit A